MISSRQYQRPSSGNAVVILLGVLVSQIGATLLVRSANLPLQKEMTAIIEKGYLAVPSPYVVTGLTGWSNAFMGGIFLTLTTGMLLILATLAVVRRLQQTKWPLSRQIGCLAPLWLMTAIFQNSTGLNGGASLYTTTVMVATAVAGLTIGGPAQRNRGALGRALILFGPLVILTGLWLTRLDADLFTDIRDRILFSNPVGIKVAEFYYDYTLYGAQVMAPLSQHTMIGVDMSTVGDDADYRGLADALRRSDVLDVGDDPGAAAVLTPEGEGILWKDATGRSLSVGRKEMLQEPQSVMRAFSRETDRNGPFRWVTLAGILVGFPVMLYLCVFAIVEGLLAFVAGRHAPWLTALLCLAIGGALYYPMAPAPGEGERGGDLMALWGQGTPAGRITVLKAAEKKGTDPLRFPDADALSHSTRLAERYWFARALSHARSERGFELLGRMMNDASPLVICQVCYAFGELGNPAAIPILLRYLNNGGDWYAQRYAYAALKKLGWQQAPQYR